MLLVLISKSSEANELLRPLRAQGLPQFRFPDRRLRIAKDSTISSRNQVGDSGSNRRVGKTAAGALVLRYVRGGEVARTCTKRRLTPANVSWPTLDDLPRTIIDNLNTFIHSKIIQPYQTF